MINVLGGEGIWRGGSAQAAAEYQTTRTSEWVFILPRQVVRAHSEMTGWRRTSYGQHGSCSRRYSAVGVEWMWGKQQARGVPWLRWADGNQSAWLGRALTDTGDVCRRAVTGPEVVEGGVQPLGVCEGR